MPDIDRAGSLLFWGYNPSVSRLAHATATTAALRRGARLVVVDPRRAGLAAKADPWLRVRPGTDAALALAIIHVMISRGWYDEPFVRPWTNAPLLVRADTGRLLRAGEPGLDAAGDHHVAWDAVVGQPVAVDPALRGTDVEDHGRLALGGAVTVDTFEGAVACRPAFDLLAEQARALPPAVAEGITGVPAAEIERAAQVLWECRPVAFYTWSGLEQHSGTTQIIRAINVLYALTGCLDAPGGNVLFTPAQSLVQLRTPVVPPVGEARPDLQVIYDLASRLGLDEHFFGGDGDAGWQYQLRPSGVTLEQLRASPSGVRVPLETRHRKYAEVGEAGVPVGFATPTGRIELYAESFLDVGEPAVPTFIEPATSPRSRPDLADRFPLVLTCAKSLHFCETQHRQVASLRSRAPDPQVELHPETAAARGIGKGDWVQIATPKGRVRARAVFNRTLDPEVVCGQHGWFEACEELGLLGHPPFGPDSANLNLVLDQTPSDPINGSAPLRAQVCDVVPVTHDDGAGMDRDVSLRSAPAERHG